LEKSFHAQNEMYENIMGKCREDINIIILQVGIDVRESMINKMILI